MIEQQCPISDAATAGRDNQVVLHHETAQLA